MTIEVLHLLPSLSLFGGTPRKIRDLIHQSPRPHGIYCWARWEDNAHTASFDEIFKSDGIPVFQGDHGRNLIKHARHIARIIDSHQIKVVHGYFETGLLLAAAVKLIRHNIKSAVSFVGFPAAGSWARNSLLSFLTQFLDEIVYVSNFTKDAFQTAYPKLSSRPSSVIYNGVKERGSILTNRGQNHIYQLITVSGLIDWKNVGLLVESLSIINSNSDKDFHLNVVGDGPQRYELEQRARSLGLNQHIAFLGYREDVGSLLSTSHVYLHPALKEGFGLAVVEAMLMELPVIVANAGALPELIEHEISGLVLNPHSPQAWADAVLQLRHNPALAMRMAIAGRKRAEEFFSISCFAENHERLYRRMLGEN